VKERRTQVPKTVGLFALLFFGIVVVLPVVAILVLTLAHEAGWS
jgi:tetrahydromethanopterin S-methyltransferase subunit B